MRKIFANKLLMLFAILILGFVLRFYNLGATPSSLNWDEVSLGYNAYSILHTGRDEYGKLLPLVLQSYDDFKPALYVYFTVPFVAIFGLTEFAVRAPSATAGVFAIALSYFLVLELFGREKVQLLKKEISPYTVALLTAFLLSISPWHLQFSRIAFESNVGLTINLCAFLLFLKGLKKPIFLPCAFALAASNIHMYQSDRVFTPLLFIALSIVFFKQLVKVKKWAIISIASAIIVASPFAIYTLSNSNALLRAKGVSVYSSQGLVKRAAIKLVTDRKNNDYIGLAFDNRRVDFLKATVFGYTSHFDLNWLFITGDIARHHAPDMGLMYLFEFPFLILGIYFFAITPISKKGKIALLIYFFLVPLPASITSGVPHAVRTLNFLPVFQVFTAFGIISVAIFFEKVWKTKAFLKIPATIVLIIYLLLALLNISYYLNQYFVQQNIVHAKEWLYGYKQAIGEVLQIQENYDRIYVENLAPLDQSYMFFLFYTKFDPREYQKLGGTISGGFAERHNGFGKFVFEPLSEVTAETRTLLIGSPQDAKYMNKILKKINYPDGQESILIGE